MSNHPSFDPDQARMIAASLREMAAFYRAAQYDWIETYECAHAAPLYDKLARILARAAHEIDAALTEHGAPQSAKGSP